MRTWLITVWDSFRTGFWFIPTVLILVALLLAVASTTLDRHLATSVPDWMKTTGSTARSTLAAQASAMMTVAGVVFSVTVVTLSITSSQLGPRLLRNFLEENITQVAMGSCIACAIYCFILMWLIDDVGGEWFVPHLSVALASLITLAALGSVVYFIHRVAHSVQPLNVVADVAGDLDSAIERLYPEPIGASFDSDQQFEELRQQFDSQASRGITIQAEGYLQAIDGETLIKTTSEHDLLVQLLWRPGEFVIADTAVARCVPVERCDDETLDKLKSTFVFGNRRTPRQDVECAIDELVEVAVRALSPGINDPLTAIASIERLAATFSRLAQRRTQEAVRADDDGQPRVLAKQVEFQHLVSVGFALIRQYGCTSAVVASALMKALQSIARRATNREQLDALVAEGERVFEAVGLHPHCDDDVQQIKNQLEELKSTCQESP